MRDQSAAGRSRPEPVVEHASSNGSVAAAIESAVEAVNRDGCARLDALDDRIDLDALDSLCRNSAGLEQAEFQLTFTVAGCKVIVYGDGRVVVSRGLDHRPGGE